MREHSPHGGAAVPAPYECRRLHSRLACAPTHRIHNELSESRKISCVGRRPPTLMDADIDLGPELRIRHEQVGNSVGSQASEVCCEVAPSATREAWLVRASAGGRVECGSLFSEGDPRTRLLLMRTTLLLRGGLGL